MSNTLTREEIERGIETMQRIQSQNPPSSREWQRASVILHKLATLRNNGVEPKDACGKR